MHRIIVLNLLSLWLLSACQPVAPSSTIPCTTEWTDPRDGATYCTTTIGSQRWLAQNLRYVLNGSFVNPQFDPNYGRLYTHAAALQACPPGWHLPTELEWQRLEASLGLTLAEQMATGYRGNDQGTQLKNDKGWERDSSTVQGTNITGFRALPAGEYNPSYGPYLGYGVQTHFWSATPADTSGGIWVRVLHNNQTGIGRTYRSEQMGLACRCVED